MRYVRANDDTARGAIQKMAEGLPPVGEPLAPPTQSSSFGIVHGGKPTA
jgi:hypothetical protein